MYSQVSMFLITKYTIFLRAR